MDFIVLNMHNIVLNMYYIVLNMYYIFLFLKNLQKGPYPNEVHWKSAAQSLQEMVFFLLKNEP